MRKSKQKGTILIPLIVAILLIGVLGVGIYRLTTSSTFTGLLSNKNDQAYQLAQAGVRYAIDKIIQQTSSYPATDFLLPDNNHKFNISVINNVITSIGIVNAGTLAEAQRQIVYSWPASLPTSGGPIITGQTGAFTPTQSTTGAITVSSTGTITLGGNIGGNSGTILYQGSSSVSNCNAGVCNFACGLRAYFQFTANEDNSSGSTSIGDGFTFAVLSALNNARNCSGGAPAGVDMGELMGYAGSGTSDGKGLQPPKMAIEFDTYPNTGTETNNGCSGNRNDSANNHMALMFWGLNLAGNCAAGSTASGYPQACFDDNIHGAGDGTINNPYNSATSGNGSGLGGYYEGTKSLTTTNCKSAPTTICNWMEDGHTYSFRLEISKADVGGNPSNGGLYQINAWIYRDSDTIPTGFNDVTNPFTVSLPQISRTVTLSAANHTALQQIYFGFTEATGAASQNIQVSNLGVFFPQTVGGTCTSACTYAINPTSASLAASAYTGQTVAVTAGTGCTWTAVSDSTTWLTVTGGTSGTSFGTVTYNVAANPGPHRIGTITIGGQTFTVTQTGNQAQTISAITFTPTTLVVGGTTTASATATSGLAVTFTSLTTGVCTVSGTNGSTVTGVTAGTCTIAANQAGNADYSAAPQVTKNITVGKGGQTISAITFTPTTLVVGGTTTASATATSGLAVTFTSLTAGVCTVSGTNGSTVTGVAPGTCTIAANQAGNANYTAAPQVTGSITVPPCTYTFGSCPAAFPRAGGTGSISVTTSATGCTWTSTDDQTWITTAPTSSSGTGSVTVTVGAGTAGNTPRTGTVTVSGTMGTTSSTTCTITENH